MTTILSEEKKTSVQKNDSNEKKNSTQKKNSDEKRESTLKENPKENDFLRFFDDDNKDSSTMAKITTFIVAYLVGFIEEFKKDVLDIHQFDRLFEISNSKKLSVMNWFVVNSLFYYMLHISKNENLQQLFNKKIDELRTHNRTDLNGKYLSLFIRFVKFELTDKEKALLKFLNNSMRILLPILNGSIRLINSDMIELELYVETAFSHFN